MLPFSSEYRRQLPPIRIRVWYNIKIKIVALIIEDLEIVIIVKRN